MIHIRCCYVEFEPKGNIMRVMSLYELGPAKPVLTVEIDGSIECFATDKVVSHAILRVRGDITMMLGKDAQPAPPPSPPNDIYTGTGWD